MNITEERIDTHSAFLKVQIQPDDYNHRLEDALKKYRRQVIMPGFRQGKVPMGIVKNRYGRALLAEELNKVLNDSIQNYLREQNINVLGSPIPSTQHQERGDWDNPGEFEFVYELGLAPNFDAGLDSKDKLTFYTIRIEDGMIDERVQQLARRYGQVRDSEKVTDASILLADIVEVEDSQEVKPGGIFKQATLFMEGIAPDAKQHLRNLAAGESAIVNPHSLSADHDELGRILGITHEQVHHLHNDVKVKVNAIKELLPAEINQELFDKYFGEGEVSSEEEFRKRIAEGIAQGYLNDSKTLFRRDLSNHLLKKTNPKLPDDFLKRWIMVSNEKPITNEQLEYEYPGYRRSLQWELIMKQLIAKKHVEVSNEEVINYAMQALAQQYAQYGIPSPDGEELRKNAINMLSKDETARGIYDNLYNEKLIAYARSAASVNEKEVSFAEFKAMAEQE